MGKEGSEERRGPSSYHREVKKLLLTQILRTRPHPPPGSRETEVAAEIQGRKRRGKGAVIILNARPRGRSGAPLRHLRFNREVRAGVLWPEGRECPPEMSRRGGKREVSAPGRSLQVSLVRSPGVRGCTELYGFLVRPTPALSLCKNSRRWRYGRRD